MQPPRRSPLPTRLALTFVVPLVILSVIEFMVASLAVAPPVPDPLVVWNARRDGEIHGSAGEFRFDRRWLWEPRPGAVVAGAPVNRGAYRGPFYPERDARGERLRIAVLGDSTTYGFGLAEDASWGRVLETLLRENGHPADVLNFGVIGFTATQGYHLYRGRVRDYHPDLVVAAFGAVNESYPELLTDDEKIARLAAPSWRVRAFLRRYETFRWLEALLGVDADTTRVQDPLTRRVPVPEFERRLADLERAVTADGGRLVLVLPPRRQDGERQHAVTREYSDALTRVAAAHHIPVADVHAAFRALERQEHGAAADDATAPAESSYFIDLWHPSPKGHRAYAVVVGRALESAGLLP